MRYRAVNVAVTLYVVLWVALGYDAITLLPGVIG